MDLQKDAKIKNKSRFYSMSLKLAGMVAFLSLATTTSIGVVSHIKPTYQLNSVEDIMKIIDILEPDTSYISLKDTMRKTLDLTNGNGIGKISRFKMPVGDTAKFALPKNFGAENTEIVKEIIEDLNIHFEEINSDYKFEVVETIPLHRTLDASYIKILSLPKLQLNGKNASGIAFSFPGLNKNESRNHLNTIFLSEEKLKFLSRDEKKRLIHHEIGHIFGLGDAYLYDDSTQRTIMTRSGKLMGFSKNDLIILYCLYGDLNKIDSFLEYLHSYENRYVESAKESMDKIQSFINSYSESDIKKIFNLDESAKVSIVKFEDTLSFKGTLSRHNFKELNNYLEYEEVLTLSKGWFNHTRLTFSTNSKSSAVITTDRFEAEEIYGNLFFRESAVYKVEDKGEVNYVLLNFHDQSIKRVYNGVDFNLEKQRLENIKKTYDNLDLEINGNYTYFEQKIANRVKELALQKLLNESYAIANNKGEKVSFTEKVFTPFVSNQYKFGSEFENKDVFFSSYISCNNGKIEKFHSFHDKSDSYSLKYTEDLKIIDGVILFDNSVFIKFDDEVVKVQWQQDKNGEIAIYFNQSIFKLHNEKNEVIEKRINSKLSSLKENKNLTMQQ